MFRDPYNRHGRNQEEEPEMKRRERFRRPSQQQSPKVSLRRNLLMAIICIGFTLCAVLMAGMR